MGEQDGCGARAASCGQTVSLERLGEALATVQRQCPELAVLAIRWMHLKHPLHPVHGSLLRGEGWRKQTSDGSGAAAAAGRRIIWLYRLVESVLYAGYCWGRLLWLHLWMRHELSALKARSFDLMIKTWVRGVGSATREEDFYYGDLTQRLAQRAVRVLLICGNGDGDGWVPFAKACAKTSLPWLSELCLVPLSAPLHMLARQWRASRRLRRLAAKADDRLVKFLALLASRDCLAPETARAGLYYWIGHAAVDTWRPRAFLTIYESQGWEQALRWGIKTADGSCRAIGYQHVPMFPEATSVLSPPWIGLPVHPDVVLCLGEISQELLRAGHAPYKTRLVRFGSVWYRASSIEHHADPARRTILVIPEGHPSEVQALFRFAYACARRMPSYTFILRRHPAFPMTRALRAVLADMPQQPNVIFSQHPQIEDAAAQASAVLYRGSSAAVSAVLQGAFPVYVPGSDGYEHDPLSGLPAWHAQCAAPEELAAVLVRHEQAPTAQLVAEWQAAVRYLKRCTGPVTDASLEELIDAGRLSRAARAPVTEAIHA